MALPPSRDEPDSAITGADLLVDSLIATGVRTLFGVPGDTGVALYDALYRRESAIRHVLARDERHAAFMADCYARVSGTVGAVEVSSGGGSTFVIGGLGESYAASVPVLVITSDIQAASRGTGALTEIDQSALFSAVTKWQRVIEKATDIPVAVVEALRQATTGRPAPVVLIVPENVLDEHADVAPPASVDLVRVPGDRTAPDPAAVRRAVGYLVEAHRPAIVAGSGVHASGAWTELAALADRLGVPVATTIHGKGAIATGSPWSLGIVGGNGGSDRANAFLREADTVLLVGTRANATDTDGWTAPPRNGPRIIGIDIDPGRAARNFPAGLPLVGDAATVLRALVDAAPEPDPERAAMLRDWVAEHAPDRSGLAAADKATTDGRLSAAAVVDTVRQVVDGTPHLVVADPGTPTPHVADLWPIANPGRTVIAPRGHGPMGYAIPAAVGASLARPDATVVAFAADGSFAMSCGELETVCRLGLPIIYVQLTNDSLGWIKMLQHLYTGRRYFGVDPGPIDSVMVAKASGLQAARAHSLADLRVHVAAAIRDHRSVYIDVPVRHMIDDVPPVSSWHAALAGASGRPAY